MNPEILIFLLIYVFGKAVSSGQIITIASILNLKKETELLFITISLPKSNYFDFPYVIKRCLRFSGTPYKYVLITFYFWIKLYCSFWFNWVECCWFTIKLYLCELVLILQKKNNFWKYVQLAIIFNYALDCSCKWNQTRS